MASLHLPPKAPPPTTSSTSGGTNNSSITSTGSNGPFPPAGAAATVTPFPPPPPRPFGQHQRSTSMATTCSREELRREVSIRGDSLTHHEQAFLDQLAIHGNEIEVNLAMERLSDKELFFSLNGDTSTPRSLDILDLRDPPSMGGLSQEQEDTTTNDQDEGTTNHEEDDAAAVAYDIDDDDDNGTEITAIPRDPPGQERNDTRETVNGSVLSRNNNNTSAAMTAASLPQQQRNRPLLRRGSSVGGSQRRLDVLEQRKNSTVHGKLWKAHENGLALTRSASRRSLFKRSISGGGGHPGVGASGHNGSIAPSMNASVNSAYMSVGSQTVEGKDTMSLNSSMGVLRLSNQSTGSLVNRNISSFVNLSHNSNGNSGSGIPPDAIFRSSNPMILRNAGGSAKVLRRPLRIPPSMSAIPPRAMRSSSTGMIAGAKWSTIQAAAKQQQQNRGGGLLSHHSLASAGAANATWNVPHIPAPAGIMRDLSENTTRSTASRKSVTFAQIDLDKDLQARPLQRSKFMRRSVSDSMQFHTRSNSSVPQDDGTNSTSNIDTNDLKRAALEHGSSSKNDPIERSTSISSIPSIRPASAIRSDSISSIPSLHHARRLRSQESLGESVPASAIRSDSITSIPSLHHARRLRSQESLGESVMSIPSIHHGHPLQNDGMSVGSITTSGLLLNAGGATGGDTMVLTYDNSDTRSTSRVAAAWLESAQQQMLVGDDDGVPKTVQAVAPPAGLRDIPTTISTSPTTVPAVVDPSSATEEPAEVTPEGTTVTVKKISPVIDPNAATPLVSNNSKEQAVPRRKPVFMRQASQNGYEGEGIEVTDATDGMALPDCSVEEFTSYFQQQHLEEQKQDQQMYQDNIHAYYRNMMSLGDMSVRTCSSWDDSSIMDRGYHPRYVHGEPDPEVFRNIRRCLSDEDMSNLFLGTSASLLLLDASAGGGGAANLDDSEGLGSSWDMNSETSGERFDPWNVLKDEYAAGYGGGGTLDFRILGTSANDESAQPHVLSPPLMESLQAFLPFSKSGENFYLKYSLLRDGDSFLTFLQRARGTNYTILAIETVDGEVFGSFTAQSWRKNWNYFGTGESFLWRMRRNRMEKTHSILEQAQMESEIDVYPFTGENRYIQLCTHDRIAVGGGNPFQDGGDDDPQTEKKEDEYVAASSSSSTPWSTTYKPVTNYNDDATRDTTNNIMDTSIGKQHEWGFGLAISEDLITGTTSRSMTFGNPPLSKVHSDGSPFEIVNLELWTLTPCYTTEEAEKLELGKLFLDRESR